MTDGHSITQLLRDAGYSHCAVSGHGPCRHKVWRTDSGELAGYMTASEVCDFLNLPDVARDTLLPHLVGFGPSPYAA